MLIILDRTLHAIGAIKDFKDTKTQGLDSHFDFIEIECLPHKDLLNENHLFFENQLYVIKEVVDTHDSKLSTKVYAEQRAVGYFLESIVRPQVFNGQSVAAIMATLLQHTDVKLGQVEDDGQLYDFEVGYQTSLKSIIDLAKLANLEIEYAAEMNGVNLARMTVNLVKERGRRIMKPFEYGINMGQVTRTKSSREQITSLIAIGKDGLTLNGVHLPGLLPEGFKVEGDYIYSEDALAEQGRHVFDVFNSSATTKAALLEESIEALKERSKVEAQYSCSIDFFKGQTGQRPHIGDTVTIKDFSFPTPLLIEARVQQIVSSRSNPQDNTVLIGNYKELTVNPWLELKTIREKIEQNIDDWNRLEKEQTIIKDQQQVIEQEQEVIKDRQDSISSTVSSNKIEQDGKITSMQSSITQQGNLISQKVSKGDVVSEINQSPTSVSINASKINFNGHVFGENATFRGDISGANITGSTFNSVSDSGDEFVTIEDGKVKAEYYDRGARTTLTSNLTGSGLGFSDSMGSTVYGKSIIDVDSDLSIKTNFDLRLRSTNGNIDIAGQSINQSNANIDFSNATFTGTPVNSSQEVGFCGIGGFGEQGIKTLAGVGVNFRVRRKYTPSTVYLSEYSGGSNTDPLTTGVNRDGFWLYIRQTADNAARGYYYWRGEYRVN